DAHEALHLRLTELRRTCPGEPAAEPTDARDPEAGLGQLEDMTLALQDDDAGILQARADTIGLIGVEVVVPEDGNDGDADPLQLVGEDIRLFLEPRFGEIARQQDHIHVPRDLREGGAQRSPRVRADVEVAGRGDLDHVTCSSPPAAGKVGTTVRLSTSRSGNRSRATSVTAARRSSVGIVPEITTRFPAMLTSSSGSITRGSVASACRRDSSRYGPGAS